MLLQGNVVQLHTIIREMINKHAPITLTKIVELQKQDTLWNKLEFENLTNFQTKRG